MSFPLYLKTVQGTAIRILIEALKDILNDTNIMFDETGMKIIAMDNTHTVMVHVKLNAENFEEYTCKKKLVVGVNMLNFFKLIKSLSNNGTLTLFIEEDNINILGIKIEDSEKNTITSYGMKLMDIDEENFRIPNAKFDYIISMPSNDFQRTIRSMSELSDLIEINSIGQKIIMKCIGDFANQETIMGEVANGLKFLQSSEENDIVSGIFSLKHLLMFTRCSNISHNIELYLKNDYPLVIRYAIANLGDIKLCLAPRVNS